VWNINYRSISEPGALIAASTYVFCSSSLSGVLQFSPFLFIFFTRVFSSGGLSSVPTLFKTLLEISSFSVRVCSRGRSKGRYDTLYCFIIACAPGGEEYCKGREEAERKSGKHVNGKGTVQVR